MRMDGLNIVVIHRWDDDLAAYDRHIDHGGHRVHYIVSPDGKKGISPYLPACAEVVEIEDLGRVEEVEAAYGRIARAVASKGGQIDKIIALSEFDLLTAGHLRSRFGVPGMGLDAVLAFRDKVIMKARVAAAGVRVPRYSAIRDVEDLRDFAASIGYPLILKPRKGAASRGVLRIDGPEELEAAARGCDLADHECEEFIEGPILHADGLRHRGATVFRAISRYVNTCLAYAQGEPLGSVTEEDPAVCAALGALAERSLDALRLDDGVFHLEMILSDRGEPSFLEVGARVGGGELPVVVNDVFGVDLVGASLQIEMGTFRASDLPDRRGIGGWMLIPEPREVPCRVVSAGSIMGQLPTLYREVVPAVGEVLDGHGGYSKIPGRFCFRGDSARAIRRDMEEALRRYRPTYEPLTA